MAATTLKRDQLPLPYWLWFLWIDPVLSLLGAYGGLLAPDLLLSSYIPADDPNVVLNPAHTFIFNQLGAFAVLTFVMGAFMLRSTEDLAAWRYYQGSICIVDIVMLISSSQAYASQGRLSPATWRPEDWFSVIGTGGCAVLRIAFLLGIGLGGKRKTN